MILRMDKRTALRHDAIGQLIFYPVWSFSLYAFYSGAGENVWQQNGRTFSNLSELISWGVGHENIYI